MRRRFLMVSILLLVVVAVAGGATQLLAGRPGGPNCPRPGPHCVCPDIYAPVVCDNDCRYSNICVARCAGATGCIGVGPGPVE